MCRTPRDRTLRTPAAIVAVAAALGLSAVAGPAAADISPADLAFLTAPEVSLAALPMHWRQTVTIRETGQVAGHPGNRHTVTVDVAKGAATFLWGTVSIADDQCDAAGTCVPVAAGTVALPDGIEPPVPAADGSVRLAIPVPGSLVRSTLPGGPAEFADADLDLTVTPVGRQPRPPLTTANADFSNHLVTAVQNDVYAQRTTEGDAVTVTGTAAGVRAADVVEGRWEEVDRAQGRGATYLAYPLGPIGIGPYVPPTRDGAVVHRSQWGYTWQGELPVGTALVTSEGYRLPGNYFQVLVFGQLILDPGSPAAGSTAPHSSYVGVRLFPRQCEPGQPVEQCTRLPQPNLTGGEPLTYRAGRNGRLQRTERAQVVSTANGQTTDRGTIGVTLDATPADLGLPQLNGSLDREHGGWAIESRVRYQGLVGAATVAGRHVRGTALAAELVYRRTGTP